MPVAAEVLECRQLLAGVIENLADQQAVTTAPAPQLTAPVSEIQQTRPTFAWTAVAGADHYDIWVNDHGNGNAKVIREENVSGTSYTDTGALTPGHRYIWTVRAFAADGTPGEWASHRIFTIAETATTGAGETAPTASFAATDVALTNKGFVTEGEITARGEFHLYRFQVTAGSTVRAITSTDGLTDSIYSSGLRLFDATGIELANNVYGHGHHALLEHTFAATGTYYVGVGNSLNREYDPADASSGSSHLLIGEYRLTLATDMVDAPSLPTRNLDTTEPPAVPTIETPTDTTSDTTPEFTWSAVAGADHYDIWVNDQSNGNTKAFRNQNVAGASYTHTVALTPGRTYIWTVRAVAANNTPGEWATHRVFTLGQNLAVPTIETPTDTTSDTTPEFTWSAVAGADHYDIWVNDQSNGNTKAFRNQNVAGTSYTDSSALTPGRTYIWTVRAVAANNTPGEWATHRVFTIGQSLGTPTIVAPGATTDDTTPQFQWSAVPGAARYDIWVNDQTNGNTKVIRNQDVAGTSYTDSGALTPGRTYIWTVRAVAANGKAGEWATHRVFTLGQSLSTPTIVTPGETTNDTTPEFTWSAVPGAARYDIWVNDQTNGNTKVIRNQDVAGTSYMDPAVLTPGHNYIWTVRAVAANGTPGEWATHQTFALTTADPSDNRNASPNSTFVATDVELTNKGFVTESEITAVGEFHLYRFQVTAGSSVRAVTSTDGWPTDGIYASSLRLFDANGTELGMNVYGYGQHALLEYTFAATGTYYVGVANSLNREYDPADPASGSNHHLFGKYRLTLATDMVDTDNPQEVEPPQEIPGTVELRDDGVLVITASSSGSIAYVMRGDMAHHRHGVPMRVELDGKLYDFSSINDVLKKVHTVQFVGGAGNDLFVRESPDFDAYWYDNVKFELVETGGGIDAVAHRRLAENGYTYQDSYIYGTDKSDKITVSLADDDHLIASGSANGQSFRFDLSTAVEDRNTAGTPRLRMWKLEVDAGDGDDTIDIQLDDSDISWEPKLYGGSGRDTIYGSGRRDSIYGGAGDDVLYGRGGRDQIYGDAGNDEIHGGDENDRLHGGDGNDTLHGDNGEDSLWGNDGIDWLYGGPERDSLYGGPDDDFLFAVLEGDEADRIEDSEGNNTINSKVNTLPEFPDFPTRTQIPINTKEPLALVFPVFDADDTKVEYKFRDQNWGGIDLIDVVQFDNEVYLIPTGAAIGNFSLDVEASDGLGTVRKRIEFEVVSSGKHNIDSSRSLPGVGGILDQEVTLLDLTTELRATANFQTGAFFAEVDTDAGLSLDTTKLKQLIAGELGLPNIDPVQIALHLQGIDVFETNNYDAVRGAYLQRYTGNDVYVSSERFTRWASLTTIADEVLKAIITEGASVEDTIAEAAQQLELEFNDILSFLENRGIALIEDMPALILESLVMQKPLELPEFTLAFDVGKVQHTYAVQVTTGDHVLETLAELAPETRQWIGSDTLQQGIKVPAASFAIILKRPQPEGFIEDTLAQFEDLLLSKPAALESLLQTTADQLISRANRNGADSEAQKILNKIVDSFAAGGSVISSLDRRLTQKLADLGIDRAQLEAVVTGQSTILDLKDTVVGNEMRNFIRKIAIGNQATVGLQTLEFDVSTFALKVEALIHHRHSLGTVEDIAATIAQKADALADAAIAKGQQALDDAKEFFNVENGTFGANIAKSVFGDFAKQFSDQTAEWRAKWGTELSSLLGKIPFPMTGTMTAEFWQAAAGGLKSLESWFSGALTNYRRQIEQGINSLEDKLEDLAVEIWEPIADLNEQLKDVGDDIADALDDLDYADKALQDFLNNIVPEPIREAVENVDPVDVLIVVSNPVIGVPIVIAKKAGILKFGLHGVFGQSTLADIETKLRSAVERHAARIFQLRDVRSTLRRELRQAHLDFPIHVAGINAEQANIVGQIRNLREKLSNLPDLDDTWQTLTQPFRDIQREIDTIRDQVAAARDAVTAQIPDFVQSRRDDVIQQFTFQESILNEVKQRVSKSTVEPLLRDLLGKSAVTDIDSLTEKLSDGVFRRVAQEVQQEKLSAQYPDLIENVRGLWDEFAMQFRSDFQQLTTSQQANVLHELRATVPAAALAALQPGQSAPHAVMTTRLFVEDPTTGTKNSQRVSFTETPSTEQATVLYGFPDVLDGSSQNSPPNTTRGATREFTTGAEPVRLTSPSISNLAEFMHFQVELPQLESGLSAQSIVDALSGTVLGILDTQTRLVLGVAGDFVHSLADFGTRVQNAADLLRSGAGDRALAKLGEGLGKLVRDLGMGVVSNAMAYTFGTASTLEAALLGRSLTQDERELAHRIFGNDINLTGIRVVPNYPLRDRATGNVVYIRDGEPLDRNKIDNFAHELTHIWQDQDLTTNITAAYREQIYNVVSGDDAYQIDVRDGITWSSLGLEQQGKVVEEYVGWLEGHALDADKLRFYRELLGQANLLTDYLYASARDHWQPLHK